MEHNTLIIGNWKLQPATEKEALALANVLNKEIRPHKKITLWICGARSVFVVTEKEIPETFVWRAGCERA
jgi:hypothetical protein